MISLLLPLSLPPLAFTAAAAFQGYVLMSNIDGRGSVGSHVLTQILSFPV